MYIRDNEVLEIFSELPNQGGYSDNELAAVETQLNVRFPTFYRHMMQHYRSRLISAGIVAPMHMLQQLRDDASSLLIEDGYNFRLSPEHVVFYWEPTYAFLFFRASGDPDTPVMLFNYHTSDDDGWEP